MAKSPPAWTAAAGGGPVIFPGDHVELFFKTNPNDGPGQTWKNAVFHRKPRVSMFKSRKKEGVFTKRTQMIKEVCITE